ncbi:unnamed protein product [Vitrella brassicaformis CCMP3155]|uniref:CUE domain-containing protein n=2 Tax=Vitrella brassicaformis TaxID=1169539 RepID=A0A0G4H1H0_VITBC|nr:unnamed protein product [Vitrella brassicaformis CCMP3155]|eukprot:CEM37446.1 unnamed protein product [Vitrella brassicaformis CCMP3155]
MKKKEPTQKYVKKHDKKDRASEAAAEPSQPTRKEIDENQRRILEDRRRQVEHRLLHQFDASQDDQQESRPIEESTFLAPDSSAVDGSGVRSVPKLAKYWSSASADGGGLVLRSHWRVFLPHDNVNAGRMMATTDGTLSLDDKIKYHESTDLSLATLLRCRFHVFWSEVVYSGTSKDSKAGAGGACSLPTFLDSYLCHVTKPWELDCVDLTKGTLTTLRDEEAEALRAAIAKKVFLVFIRLVSIKESDSEYLSARKHQDILCDQKLLTASQLLDIAALYGPANEERVKGFICEVFDALPRRQDELLEYIPTLLHSFNTGYERLAILLKQTGSLSLSTLSAKKDGSDDPDDFGKEFSTKWLANTLDTLSFLIDGAVTIGGALLFFPPEVVRAFVMTRFAKEQQQAASSSVAAAPDESAPAAMVMPMGSPLLGLLAKTYSLLVSPACAALYQPGSSVRVDPGSHTASFRFAQQRARLAAANGIVVTLQALLGFREDEAVPSSSSSSDPPPAPSKGSADEFTAWALEFSEGCQSAGEDGGKWLKQDFSRMGIQKTIDEWRDGTTMDGSTKEFIEIAFNLRQPDMSPRASDGPSTARSKVDTTISKEEMDAIQTIREIAGEVAGEEGFVLQLVKSFDAQVNMIVNHLFEGSLPPHLAALDRRMTLQEGIKLLEKGGSRPVSSPSQSPPPAAAAAAAAASVPQVAPRPRRARPTVRMEGDEGLEMSAAEKSRILDTALRVDEYDDEYDDTDMANYNIAAEIGDTGESDEEDEEEEDEKGEGAGAIRDPRWGPDKMRGGRLPRGRGLPVHGQTIQARRKEEHKGRIANHNRRQGAWKKAQKGMLGGF